MTEPDQPVPVDDDTLREALAYYDTLPGLPASGTGRCPGVQAAVRHGTSGWSTPPPSGTPTSRTTSRSTDRHLFRIASHSKTFTATAIMQLVQDGRLRLDDTAGRLGDRSLVDDASPLASATVRDLLAHASGVFRDSDDGDFWHLVGAFPDRDRLRAILAQSDAAVVAPNERFKYSNIGYGLLGLIIEAVTGTDYNGHLIGPPSSGRARRSPTSAPSWSPDRLGDYAVGYSALAYADTPGADRTRRHGGALRRDRVLCHGSRPDRATSPRTSSATTDLLTDASKRMMQHPVWDTDTPTGATPSVWPSRPWVIGP